MLLARGKLLVQVVRALLGLVSVVHLLLHGALKLGHIGTVRCALSVEVRSHAGGLGNLRLVGEHARYAERSK